MPTLLNLRPLTSPPCFHSFPSSSLCNFRPNQRFHFLTPCSSLKSTRKQQTLQKTKAPQGLRWFFNPKGDDDDNDSFKRDDQVEGGLEGDTAVKGTLVAGLLLVGVVGGFAGVGYVYKDQINAFLNQFSGIIEGYGPAGYALFVAVYAGLEVYVLYSLPIVVTKL